MYPSASSSSSSVSWSVLARYCSTQMFGVHDAMFCSPQPYGIRSRFFRFESVGPIMSPLNIEKNYHHVKKSPTFYYSSVIFQAKINLYMFGKSVNSTHSSSQYYPLIHLKCWFKDMLWNEHNILFISIFFSKLNPLTRNCRF